MNQPNLKDLCASCGHMFGMHYLRFDKKVGCSYYSDSQREGTNLCYCQGFAVKFDMQTYMDSMELKQCTDC